MDRYTLAQRIEIVKIHYKNGENIAETVRKVRTAFGHHQAPSRTAIVNLINKFERLGQVSDVKTPTRARPARSAENIAAVAESVAENRGLSISRRSQELGISQASLHRILHKDLGLHAYKLQLTQELKPADHAQRRTMALLREKFPGRVISRNGDFNWPPRSCDLTPLDFFLWGYVKDKVYANAPATIQALKDNIRAAIGEIQPLLCENVMKNFIKRMTVCKKSRGGHLADIVFHY